VLKGQHDAGGSRAFSGKPAQQSASLKCLYPHRWSMGNKQEELEVHMQLQGYHCIDTLAMWCDHWSVAMDRYRIKRMG